MMLTIGEISERCNVSQDFIRDEIKRGNVPAYKLGRVVRIREDEWNAYLARNRIFPRPSAANDNRKSKSHREAVDKLKSILGG